MNKLDKGQEEGESTAHANVRYLAKQMGQELEEEVEAEFNALLQKQKGKGGEVAHDTPPPSRSQRLQVEQYRSAIKAATDPAVIAYGTRKCEQVKHLLETMAREAQGKKLQGEVSVEAAIVGLSAKLKQAAAWDVFAQEEIRQRTADILALAEARGVSFPAQVDQTEFEQSLQVIPI